MTKEMQTKVEDYARVHKSLLNQTKLDAIDWYLDNVWHNKDEEPELYRELLCEWYAKGDINHLTPFHDVAFYHRSDKTFWNGKQQIENVIKWAYIEDLYKSFEHE